jgi:uncharacterized protein YbaP (TraB family)
MMTFGDIVSSIVSGILALAVRHTGGVEGVEPRLAARSQQLDRKIFYLEDADGFVAAVDSIPYQSLQDGVNLLLDNLSKIRAHSISIYEAWVFGDLSAVQRAMERTPLHRIQPMNEAVFRRRNLAWMPGLRAIASSQRRTLVAVGAGHLCCGSDSVLQVMEREGFHLTALQI